MAFLFSGLYETIPDIDLYFEDDSAGRWFLERKAS